MRTTLAAVNQELARCGYTARLAKATGYFFFLFGDAADWLDRTVQVERISAKTVEDWIAEFERLSAVNAKLSGELGARRPKRRA
jgi:hypothetical protein